MATTSSNPAGITKRSSSYFADPLRILIQPKGDPAARRNTRFDFGDLDEDLGSMKTSGFHAHKPLLVKRIKGNPDFDFELIDGERRLTYVLQLLSKKLAEFPDGVPVVIEDANSTDVQLIVKMLTANTGRRFNPLEEAQAIKKLRDGGMSVKDICKNIGKYERQVREALALLDAAPEVLEAVEKKEISTTLARNIATKHKGNKEAQKAATEKAAKGDKKTKKVVAEEVSRVERRRLKPGQEVKVKQLGPQQIADLESVIAKKFVEAMNAGPGVGNWTLEGVKSDIKKDDKQAQAYLLGAAQALQAVLGHKVNVSV